MLLLDVDGVIIRDESLLSHMKNNVVRYVKKKIPSLKRPDLVNTILYKAYGHTALGLTREYGIFTDDFNEFVYDEHLISHLHDFLTSSKDFERDKKTIRHFCDEEDVSFFSNSPMIWTEPIREAIDLRIGNSEGFMKPTVESYLRFGDSDEITFVDDNIVNLLPTLYLNNWNPVHFSEKVESQKIRNVKSLDQIF
jgi:hypothetical protein